MRLVLPGLRRKIEPASRSARIRFCSSHSLHEPHHTFAIHPTRGAYDRSLRIQPVGVSAMRIGTPSMKKGRGSSGHPVPSGKVRSGPGLYSVWSDVYFPQSPVFPSLPREFRLSKCELAGRRPDSTMLTRRIKSRVKWRKKVVRAEPISWIIVRTVRSVSPLLAP
jgi:hypothetical protein